MIFNSFLKVHVLQILVNGVFLKCCWIQWQKYCDNSERARTCHLLCKRPGCYHRTSKTRVSDRIYLKEDCIPVWCVPLAHWPYLPAWSALGGCVPDPRGVYLVGGCTWSQGVYLVRGVYLVYGGVPGPGVYLVPGRGLYLVPGGCLLWGVYLVPGGVPAQVPPPCEQNFWHIKYYLAPNFVCGR